MSSIQEYGELFERLNLTEMEVEEGDFRLKLKKEAPESAPKSLNHEEKEDLQGNSEEKQKIVDIRQASTETAQYKEIVKAPILGIFYPRANEEDKVSVGDSVKKGDVLCTIEAMKMMNEVKAPVDGVIREICAKEGDLVEYKQKLFAIG
jgi:acetyl-CoA carboxylase biotin carboxyl carrier protein